MSSEPPPLLLRLAVVAGAFTLLLGVVGVAFLILRDDEGASAAGPGLGEVVRIVGAAEDASLRVNVSWQDGPILHNEPARSLGGDGTTFLLPPGLTGRTVVLEITDSETSRPLASREVLLRGGEEVQLQVDQAAER